MPGTVEKRLDMAETSKFMKFGLNGADLTAEQFRTISQTVHRICGINLRSGKEALVRSRLMKRMRLLGIGSFDEYLAYMNDDGSGKELGHMIDAITTNKTAFFREAEHFTYLRKHILPGTTNKRIRFWSAGCSSGEEPYSLAIILHEDIPYVNCADVKILATDISVRMLDRVRTGAYGEHALQGVPPTLIQKYFDRRNSAAECTYRIKDCVKSLVQVVWLNLIDPWPMKGPFAGIFCRNVMIYFDRPTQQKLVNRFWDLLEPGGHLFVGHSESLSGISHKFLYVRPAVYQKPIG